MRFLAIILSLATIGPPAAEPVYELTLDPSARTVDGQPLYVTDEQLRAKIPELRNLGERIETCMQGMTPLPMSYYFTYRPTVTAPHEALTTSVQCEGNSGDTDIRCRADISRNAVVFDEDPSHYFALGPNTDRGAAIEIFHAFEEGRIVYSEETKPRIKGLKVSEITQEGSTFVVGKANCVCNEKVAIERRSEGNAVSFVAIKKLEGMCI